MHGDSTWKGRYDAGVDGDSPAGKTDLQDHFKAGTKSGIHTPQDSLARYAEIRGQLWGNLQGCHVPPLAWKSQIVQGIPETISLQFCDDRTVFATPRNFLWVLGFKLMLAKQVFSPTLQQAL